MTDRPIIFSGAMVRALLAGRKTQTRRLASSPLARCVVGDRLYVREAWAPLSACTHNDPGSQAFADNGFYRADDSTILDEISRWTPSIHQPRWASRLTLTVTDVRTAKLRSISATDAKAEGLEHGYIGGLLPSFRGTPDLDWRMYPDDAFGDLWDGLHTAPGERWADDPTIVALTFTVTAGNIDRIAA